MCSANHLISTHARTRASAHTFVYSNKGLSDVAWGKLFPSCEMETIKDGFTKYVEYVKTREKYQQTGSEPTAGGKSASSNMPNTGLGELDTDLQALLDPLDYACLKEARNAFTSKMLPLKTGTHERKFHFVTDKIIKDLHDVLKARLQHSTNYNQACQVLKVYIDNMDAYVKTNGMSENLFAVVCLWLLAYVTHRTSMILNCISTVTTDESAPGQVQERTLRKQCVKWYCHS